MHVPLKEKIGYAMGDVASNFYWRVFDVFLFIFYGYIFYDVLQLVVYYFFSLFWYMIQLELANDLLTHSFHTKLHDSAHLKNPFLNQWSFFYPTAPNLRYQVPKGRWRSTQSKGNYLALGNNWELGKKYPNFI